MTSASGPLFVASCIAVGIVLVGLVVKVWTGYFDRLSWSEQQEISRTPTVLWPIFATLVAGTVAVVGSTSAWSHLQSTTAKTSTYQNPVEQAERQKVLETPAPTAEELQARREVQHQRSEVEPQVKAVESFDETMRQETEKIRQRSLATTATTRPARSEKN